MWYWSGFRSRPTASSTGARCLRRRCEGLRCGGGRARRRRRSCARWVGEGRGVAALEAGLWDVMERHESLRTIFPEREGVAHQEILAASAVRARLVVSAVSAAALAGALGRAAGEGFDLSAEPPLRAHLFELSERAHVLLLLLHHIAGDGWSFARP